MNIIILILLIAFMAQSLIILFILKALKFVLETEVFLLTIAKRSLTADKSKKLLWEEMEDLI